MTCTCVMVSPFPAALSVYRVITGAKTVTIPEAWPCKSKHRYIYISTVVVYIHWLTRGIARESALSHVYDRSKPAPEVMACKIFSFMTLSFVYSGSCRKKRH